MKLRELYDYDFISQNYIIQKAEGTLSPFIDFFWESNYNNHLPRFSIQTFPRIGSTLLFNIKGQFTFKKREFEFTNNEHIYYLRDAMIETTHTADSKLFGIQFKINLPLLITNRSLYSANGIYPANQLFNPEFITSIVEAPGFANKIELIEKYFNSRLTKKIEARGDIINSIIIDQKENQIPRNFNPVSKEIPCSAKTIERYFKKCTGLAPQKAIRLINTRLALCKKIQQPKTFDPFEYGFYDSSHFYKAVKKLISGY